MAKKKVLSKINKVPKDKIKSQWHAIPLKESFMVASIIGFLFTAYIIYPRSLNFGIAFMIVFAVMFIASLVSMSKASIEGK